MQHQSRIPAFSLWPSPLQFENASPRSVGKGLAGNKDTRPARPPCKLQPSKRCAASGMVCGRHDRGFWLAKGCAAQPLGAMQMAPRNPPNGPNPSSALLGTWLQWLVELG